MITTAIALGAFILIFSIKYANTIQVSATNEPTDISIPPDIITIVMPVAITISPALDMKRFKNTCGF